MVGEMPTREFSKPTIRENRWTDDNSYIRGLLVIGATAVIRFARQDNASKSWAAALLERKPARVVSVALANKTARIAWAILAHNQSYTAAAL